MEEVTDFSYGVVPLHKDADEWKVLVVHQISYRGSNDTFWILPKGHAEAGESELEAARRELEEETGVCNVQLLSEPTFPITYSFVHDGKRINKTVIYYIGLCEDTETKITQPEEIKELAWLSFKDASNKVAHQNSRDVLAKVKEHILRTNK